MVELLLRKVKIHLTTLRHKLIYYSGKDVTVAMTIKTKQALS